MVVVDAAASAAAAVEVASLYRLQSYHLLVHTFMCESSTKPVAWMVKLGQDFLDIHIPRAVLENSLRNFATLTVGDCVAGLLLFRVSAYSKTKRKTNKINELLMILLLTVVASIPCLLLIG